MVCTVNYENIFRRFNSDPAWVKPDHCINLGDGHQDQKLRDTMILVFCQKDAQQAVGQVPDLNFNVAYSSKPIEFATNIVTYIFCSPNWQRLLDELENALFFFCPFYNE